MAAIVSVTLSASAYTALGTTEANVGVFVGRGQRVRVAVGASAPAAGTTNYIPLDGPSADDGLVRFVDLRSFGLGGGDEVYAMSELGPVALSVVRGGAPDQIDEAGNTIVRPYRAGMVSYRAFGLAYAAYATPTDMFAIHGSASKTVVVSAMYMQIQTTAAALQTIDFVKRSTANSGGTPSALTAIPADSSDPAATALVQTYGAAPTTGSLVGNYLVTQVNSGTLTGPGGVNSLGLNIAAASAITLPKPPVLRGITQCLAMNYRGAALTVGFAAICGIEWAEY